MTEKDKQVVTEVTSIKKEEDRTGQKINVPDPDKMVQMASSSLLRQRKLLHSTMSLKSTSKRAMVRAIIAGLDLPVDGVPVTLKDDVEKQMFAAIQRAISDRFIIYYHHIQQEMKAEMQQRAEAAKAQAEAEKAKKKKAPKKANKTKTAKKKENDDG